MLPNNPKNTGHLEWNALGDFSEFKTNGFRKSTRSITYCEYAKCSMQNKKSIQIMPCHQQGRHISSE